MNKLLIALGLLTILPGCSNNRNQEEQLHLLAINRANVIQSKLPVESGPLSIMRASANGHTVELMMIYNESASGAKPIQAVLKQSVAAYCRKSETKANMDAGIDYRIKIRNPRGQLMVDQPVTLEVCKKLS